jgi:formylglycine-generating enzyme required for sulfatase activity
MDDSPIERKDLIPPILDAARGRGQNRDRGTYNGDLDNGHLICESGNRVLAPMGWFCGNSSDTTHPVRQKRANDNGLYDILGNVFQWCHDWYGTYPSGSVTDPVGATSGSGRVFRGGSWDDLARYTRAANRAGRGPAIRFNLVGLRLARSGP